METLQKITHAAPAEIQEIADTEDTARALTLGYVLALSIIAILSVTVHFLLENVIVNQSSSATVVNVSGRQRMLSQRIAMFANEYVAGASSDAGPPARTALLDAVEQMERAHQGLLHGDPALGLPDELSAASQRIYYQGPWQVDAQVQDFLAAARTLAANPADTYSLTRLRDAAHGPLLKGLDHAVGNFEKESIERVEKIRLGQKAVLVVIILTLFCEALFIFKPLVMRVRIFAQALYDLAITDTLTAAPNRRQIWLAAQKSLAQCQRQQLPWTVLMLDVDKFKLINDCYGHDAGDAALKALTRVIESSLRLSDYFGRWGGEEFLIVLPHTPSDKALLVAERIRSAAAAEVIDFAEQTIHLTVSIGLASQAHGDTLEAIVRRSDQALLQAKAEGRNRVISA